jgi:hypothetical protein
MNRMAGARMGSEKKAEIADGRSGAASGLESHVASERGYHSAMHMLVSFTKVWARVSSKALTRLDDA